MAKASHVVLALVLVCGTGAVAREWQEAQADKGTISFQFVPKQRDSPIAVLSWSLDRENLWRPWIQVHNHSNRSLSGVVPVVVVSTPTSVERIDLPEVAAGLDAGQTARFQLELPDRWRDGPWHSYTAGAVVTLAFAAARFADGTRWESVSSASGAFAVSPDVDVRPPPGGLIQARPARLGDELMFTSSVSEYPISSNLGDGTCVMSACPFGGFCEFDGCQILR
jgi:hypothetical protein